MDENPGHARIVLLQSLVSSMKHACNIERGSYFLYKIFVLHDGATPHASKKMMTVLEPFSRYRLIWMNRWLARNPDLSPPDFFLWSFLKDTVYRNQPRTEGKLKDATETEIKAITECWYKKCSKICWGRWMSAEQYATFNSSASCNYYIFKINSTFSIKFWNFNRMHFSVTLQIHFRARRCQKYALYQRRL